MNNKEIIEEFEQTIPDKLKVGGFVVDEKDLEVEVDFRPLKKPLKELLKKALAQQKEELNKKWEKKTIIIPKGKLHPVHDRCEECISIGRQEMREEFKENMTQIVIEDVPHRYQSRLLKTLKQ